MRSLPRCRSIFKPLSAYALLLALVFGALQPANAADTTDRPVFSASFIQLWNAQNDWTQEDWNRLCARLADMRVRELILQWTLVTDPAFRWRLTEKRRWEVPNDPVDPAPAVERALRAAEQYGLRVRFGLTHDPNWWGGIANPLKLVKVFLERLWQDQSALAQTLVRRFGNSPAFAGFYIPQEIDDKTWLPPEMFDALAGHLQRLAALLHKLAPESSVAISCFFNGYDAPEQTTKFWRTLLARTNLDAVFIQDGIGADKLTFKEAALYLRAVAKGARLAGKQAQAIVELFAPASDSQNSGLPETPETQDADAAQATPLFAPAPLPRILRQLRLAADTVGPEIIAFSLPEYATPYGGEKPARLGAAYEAYAKGEK